MFICIEGGEVSGKSTQVHLVSEWMQNHCVPVLETKEPGCKINPVCSDIRKLLLNPSYDITEKSALLLFLADRAQHYEKVIIPHLKLRYNVVSDRSSLSTLVYHLASKEKMWDFSDISKEFLAQMLNFAQPVSPDLCFIAFADGDFADKILTARSGSDRIEDKGLEFHRKVRKYFELFADKDSCEEASFFYKQDFFPKNILKLPVVPDNSKLQVSHFILSAISDLERSN